MKVTRAPQGKKRWIFPDFGNGQIATTSTSPTVARVYLQLFEINVPQSVDQISWSNGATAAGNVRVGIYGPITTEETCEAAPLAVESASTAVSGTNQPQVVSLATTYLPTGRYYVAIQFSDNTTTFLRQSSNQQIAGMTQYFDRSGGYGAFTNPCPTPTNSATDMAGIRIRGVLP